MLNFMRIILLLTIFLHIMYVQLYECEYIVNVYFELVLLGKWLFVFDCNIKILQCSNRSHCMLYELVNFFVL